jgi:hypothetical protein
MQAHWSAPQPTSSFWWVAHTTPPPGARGPPHAAPPSYTSRPACLLHHNFILTLLPPTSHSLRLYTPHHLHRCTNLHSLPITSSFNPQKLPGFRLPFYIPSSRFIPPTPPLRPSSFTIKSLSNNHLGPNYKNYPAFDFLFTFLLHGLYLRHPHAQVASP